jgi:hypothetical protein
MEGWPDPAAMSSLLVTVIWWLLREKKAPIVTCIEEWSTSDILKLRKTDILWSVQSFINYFIVAKLSSAQRRSYYKVAKLPIWMITQSHLIFEESINLEKKNGALTYPTEENHRFTVMNNQRSSNPIEPIKITKCRQICVTTYKRSSSHGKKDIKDETLRIQQATYMI